MKKTVKHTAEALLLAILLTLSANAQSNKDLLLKGLKERNLTELQRLSKQKLEAEDKLILKAFLTTNGDSAAGFYEELLSAYPESIYAGFAQERMNEYNYVNDFFYVPAVKLPENAIPSVDSAAKSPSSVVPKPSSQEPTPKPATPLPIVSEPVTKPLATAEPPKPKPPQASTVSPAKGRETFRLQFGSFKEKRGADRFAELLKAYNVKVVEEKDSKNNVLYKVKSQKEYPSREDAKEASVNIPHQSFVVSEEN